jgi:MscS family membrane protein
VDVTTIAAVGKLIRLSIIITATLVGLQSLGFSISGVLAFGGVGGIAVGFAAKDLLANFFGAIMIYLDRPFVVGEWIRSPDREIEGTVEEIGWRLTRIRTFDKRPLYVPNSVFTQIAVENPARMANRRINETIGIRYDDLHEMAAIVDEVKTMLREHPEIDQQQTLIVNLNAFAASSVDFLVYTFTRTTEWIRYHEIKQDVLLKIAAIIESHGAEIAFPTHTLHVPDGLSLAGEQQTSARTGDAPATESSPQ